MKYIFSILILALTFSVYAKKSSEFNFTVTDQQVELLRWALDQQHPNSTITIDAQTIKEFENKTGKDYADHKYYGAYDLTSLKNKETKVVCYNASHCEIQLFKEPEQAGLVDNISETIAYITVSGLCLVIDNENLCEEVSNYRKEDSDPIQVGRLKLKKSDLIGLERLFEKHKKSEGVIDLMNSKVTKANVGQHNYTCKHIQIYFDQPGVQSCYTTIPVSDGSHMVSSRDHKTLSSIGLMDSTNPFMANTTSPNSSNSQNGAR